MNRGWSITSDSLAQNCASQTLNGLFSYDIDSNGCDINDPKALNVHLNISNTETSIDVIAIDGEYSANLRPGTYTITPIIDNQHFNISPINASVTINQTGIINQDFCITDLGMFNDLEVVLFPIGDSRPGFDANYKLVYRNKGTSVLSGTINTQFENDYMTFLNASPAVTSTSLGVLNWNYSNIQPFETREILINFNLNTPTDPNFPLQLDDLLVFRSDINYNGTDATPYDNTFITRQKVVNSYDPNDKTCLQGETILPNEVGEFVHYRIRFENEGTASAVNVKIIDYIDTAKYDVSTLTPLSSSHDYTTTIFDGNKVEFQFDNINLPFTAPASLGYVLFKIKTLDTLVLGDDFSNQAEIYFDFNAPIITNLETTAVAVPASITDRDLIQLQLVPNPANSLVTISSKINFQHITIYNTSGQVVFNNSFSSSILSHTLELENLPSGLYFVEISNTDHKALKKLLKQ
ncbi:chitinase [Nonlabens ulvanivorans]|nr:T9SS type A sorting domain-containing protein [Nonlabens ulvanivorans]GAK90268.1 chitinase [Nonlabens ulvanivorans]